MLLHEAQVQRAALRLEQALRAHVAGLAPRVPGTTDAVAAPIGFFDLVTWLGTFVTLVVVVVVAGALVAIYAKRREEAALRANAVTGMRQAWIERVRDTMVTVIAEARLLREASVVARSDADGASGLLAAISALELRINPTEGHHVVLVRAVRALAAEAGIEAQLAGGTPSAAANATEAAILQ